MPDTPPPGHDDATSRFVVDLSGLTLLGQYRVERKLAEGGMGAIYLAEDTNLGRPVVVKVPHPRFLGDAEFRERLAREIGELTRLEHPHIVRIVARGEHEDSPFFVLQYLGGGSLEDRLAAQPDGRMSAADTLPVFETVAATLDFVHERGIVHRDVKPANILFDEAGHVFLSDFGVAKTLQSEGVELTGTGVSIGSPKYMAPEQGMGKAVGPAADQYALASTLYEALAGRPPFLGEQVVEVLVRKMREDAPPIAEFAADLPDEAAAAVMRALARDPDERFESCGVFLEAFGVGREPARAEPARRSPARAAVASRRRAAARPPASRRWRLGLIVLAVLLASGLVYALALRSKAPGPTVKTEGPETEAPEERPAVSEQIVLRNAGQEPREVRRYFVAEGAREKLRVRVMAETEHLVDGEAREIPAQPPAEMESALLVRDLRADGTFEFGWEVVECDVAADHRHEATREQRRQLAGVRGTAALAVADDRGQLLQVEFEDAEKLALFRRPGGAGFGVGVEMLFVPLPEEPFGVGASWDITRSVDHQGIRLTRTTSYELLSVEGYELRIRHAQVFAAPPQLASPPNLRPDVKVHLKELFISADGETLVDLSRAVPIRATFDVNVRVRSENRMGTRTWEEVVNQTVRTALTRR